MPNFVAVDGESVTLPDGEHRYVMIGTSLGASITKSEGLTTTDCLNFLFQVKEWAPPKSVMVGFAFNYDINMILKDVGKARLIELWKDGSCQWGRWEFHWIPSKMFRIKRGRKSVTVADTFGFFQCSFAKALEGWGVEAPDQLDEMKAARSDFTDEDIPAMLTYCLSECDALVELMNALAESLKSVNLKVPNWIGAGAIAGALLRREGIGAHVVPDETYPDARRTAVLSAYFGGRTELFQQGAFNVLHGYDIRSAYPWAMQSLPSLVGGRWQYRKGARLPSSLSSVCHVSWDVPVDAYVMPFPVRSKRQISYPSDGEGWYWRPEVENALNVFGDAVTIHESYEYVPPPGNVRPFDFIPEIYEQRAELKRQGHWGQKSLKLAINALYGKLAQGVGYNGKPPAYRSYVWAGLITSLTRAKMFQLAQHDPEAVAMICTDGIYFTRPQPVEDVDELGGMEVGRIDQTFIAQAGIYEGMSDGKQYLRSRGVFAKDIDFPAMRKGYEEVGPLYVSRGKSRRFVGLGSCIVRRNFDEWRTWQEQDRVVSLAPGRKFVEDDDARPTRHMPPSGPGEPSAPYEPKRSGMDAPGIREWVRELDPELVEWWQVMEQPLREGM